MSYILDIFSNGVVNAHDSEHYAPEYVYGCHHLTHYNIPGTAVAMSGTLVGEECVDGELAIPDGTVFKYFPLCVSSEGCSGLEDVLEALIAENTISDCNWTNVTVYNFEETYTGSLVAKE